MDADTLQSEMSRLEAEVRSSREEAARLRTSATGNRTTGNDSEADADEQQAAELDRKADSAEQQLRSAQSAFTDTVGRIREIDRQQAEESSNHERRMAELQREKDRLSGSPGTISTSLF